MIAGDTSAPQAAQIDAVASVKTEPHWQCGESVLPTPVSVMAPVDDLRRGDAVPPLTLRQKIQIAPFIIALREYHMPACFHCAKLCFAFTALAVALGVFRENKGRSWRRAARTATARYLLSARVWTAWELKSAVGLTTAQTYEAWARRTNGTEVLTDELPEGAKLHWIGPRRVDRVILYFSGARPTPMFFAFACFDRGVA
jgi:hypothetical protein